MKLLLISDSGMNVNKGGFQQTLYNIFSFLHPADFLLITSVQANKVAPASAPFTSRVLTYNIQVIQLQQNRLGKYFNGYINAINLHINKWISRFFFLQEEIKKFNPDIVVVAPNGSEGVVIYDSLKSSFTGKKVFPYFMDDWLYQIGKNKTGKYVHALAKQLLQTNTSWLMISESLGKIFKERYTIEPARILVIHNPVNLSGIVIPEPVHQKKSYTIAYAGALWPMHFDAFIVIAKAIQLLQQQRQLKLIVYTGKSNWDWRKDELQSLDVIYGGQVPYESVHQTLANADCLLVTSSFTAAWETHSKGSVQTKITDYLKAGRLIISCGPSYAANNYFLKQFHCGVCIETNIVTEVAKQLNEILNNIEQYEQYVQQGYAVLKEAFSFEVVHEGLKQFLAA